MPIQGFQPTQSPQLPQMTQATSCQNLDLGLFTDATPETVPQIAADEFSAAAAEGTANPSLMLPKAILLPVYTTYGTPTKVIIRGRALEDDTKPAKADDSWLRNFRRSINEFESDEIPKLKLEVEFEGKSYSVTTDKEGFFELHLEPSPPLKPGIHPVNVKLAEAHPRYLSQPSQGQVHIHEDNQPSLGVISDIDDTILQSHVTDKLKLVECMLFKNSTTQDAVPGMAELYQALERQDQRQDGDIHYLSGSPVNFEERLGEFMSLNDFPKGSLDLKNLGFGPNTDKLRAQEEYKLGKLRKLFETYPERRFILIGDNGEKDPEIYRRIQGEYPDRVQGVLIRNVRDDAFNNARYAGQTLFNFASQAAEVAYAKGWIKAGDVAAVRQAEVPK